MRGGVTVNDLLHVYTHEDIVIFYDIIKENIQNSKEAKMPLV